ncbi:MAG TPA: GNAT family N-acetyltransferase [Solirubrobacteraceae bacterium]|nr:GNAT family N-acetyltransferase [Solirubrobacteraceae bacterium]
MEFVEFEHMTTGRRDELEGDENDPFDEQGITLRFQRKDRHVGLRDDHGRLIASAGLLVVEVDVGGERFPVVGLGGVIVNVNHRGRGLARTVVNAAIAKAATLGPKFVILFCHEDRTGLYRRLGFEELEPPVLVRQPQGYVEMPMRTMWRALAGDARWPDGRLTVDDLPF